ncbi:MAG: hypothetical protein HDT14_01985 [Oscillibacter sp.]|nr:hypothetical protein [Oscillibacter sp.]
MFIFLICSFRGQNKIASKKWLKAVIQCCDKHGNRGLFKPLYRLAKKIEKHSAKYTPLRFFYLLRDDIFDTKDRTKFFDYIVPVVPVRGRQAEEAVRGMIRGRNPLDKAETLKPQRFQGFKMAEMERFELSIPF